jgi:hypothetical protein
LAGTSAGLFLATSLDAASTVLVEEGGTAIGKTQFRSPQRSSPHDHALPHHITTE